MFRYKPVVVTTSGGSGSSRRPFGVRGRAANAHRQILTFTGDYCLDDLDEEQKLTFIREKIRMIQHVQPKELNGGSENLLRQLYGQNFWVRSNFFSFQKTH